MHHLFAASSLASRIYTASSLARRPFATSSVAASSFAASSLARRLCAASTQRRRSTKMTNDDAAPIYICKSTNQKYTLLKALREYMLQMSTSKMGTIIKGC